MHITNQCKGTGPRAGDGLTALDRVIRNGLFKEHRRQFLGMCERRTSQREMLSACTLQNKANKAASPHVCVRNG